jgi:alkaline phosphatase
LPPATYQGKNYYEEFASAGYDVVHNNTALKRLRNEKRALGVFSTSNLVRLSITTSLYVAHRRHQAKWLDREVYTHNLRNQSNSPTGDKTDALDQPGLKDMTLKAIDICSTRARKDKSGFFIMSEAASIDKMMVCVSVHSMPSYAENI